MSNIRKDLSITRTATNQDLTPDFTYEELQNYIWKDLDAIYALQERLPNDIDATQISRRYGISMNSAWRRMEKMVITGEFEMVTVHDDTSKTGQRKVIRRVK